MKPTSLLLIPLCIAAANTATARDAETSTDKDRVDFLTIVDTKFASWDADTDGELERGELDKLVADREILGDQAAAVAALKRASRYKKIELPKFTAKAIHELAEKKPAKDWPNLAAMYASGVKRLAKVQQRVLFASGKPRLETVHQGPMGNCFSLAPLGAIAQGRPEYIVDEMIKPLPDNRYEVKLGKKKVTVDAPTDAELAMTAGNESDGIWVNVYEKAAGEAHNELKPEEKRESTGLDALSKGGSAGTQLAFITGHEMYRLSCKFAKEEKISKEEFDQKLNEIREALKSATKEKRLMTCGTVKATIPGITPGHAYAVLSYDAEKDLIRVWNPHGDTRTIKGEPGPANGYPMTDGVFDMPLPVFVKEFAGLAFEILPKS
ncbi:C2 family cysteine protease [Brevifollis gellanilyticus]|uniref:Calpain catalytic domain-containing protein n=1 Tax=Brevifollis gellanilyticus TaxID=748831 RepID=A0A512MGA0_9BACT|nr:C2 family cysteine protease [Brevifollis gellanilyticus]GEP45770.1 hypothetical protein BGE01nite_50610 [Brevifollis gellanilyticus]